MNFDNIEINIDIQNLNFDISKLISIFKTLISIILKLISIFKTWITLILKLLSIFILISIPNPDSNYETGKNPLEINIYYINKTLAGIKLKNILLITDPCSIYLPEAQKCNRENIDFEENVDIENID